MSINFKKPALAAISAFGVLAVAPFACCDEKGKIDPFHMQIVGKYFDSAQDIANLEMVNRKFKCISKKYKFNPVPYNKFVFRDIETCQVYPEEFGRIVKFDKNIKHIIYLEGSFTTYLLRKVLADNGALDWEHEIVFNDLKNAIYGFRLHFYNQDKVITFCFNPLKMLKMFNYGNQVMIDSLLSDFSAFVDYCEIDPGIKYEELSKTLESFVLPDDVVNLEAGTFTNLKNLKKLYISDFVESVSNYAFEGCNNLTEIHYKGKVYRSPKDFTIAFKVGQYSDGENFENVKIRDSISEIKKYAFEMCTPLKSVVIPNSVKNISGDAFLNCEYLTSVSIPDSVTAIGPQAFGRCLNLTEINIPDSVKKMGSAVFYSCEKLSSVKLSSSIKAISTSFFAACDKLKNIKIPEGVKEIGNYAFFKCFSLEEIVIPKSVSRIGIRLFDTCTSLKKVQILGSIEEISSGMFINCKLLEDIQIPDSVTVIGEKAFENCKSLKEIKLPKNLKIICDYAFNSCVSLEKIVVPDDTVAIGYGVFENCTNLKTISYRGKDYSSAEEFINDFIF